MLVQLEGIKVSPSTESLRCDRLLKQTTFSGGGKQWRLRDRTTDVSKRMMDTFRDYFKYNARDADGTQSPSEALRPKSSKEEKIKRSAEKTDRPQNEAVSGLLNHARAFRRVLSPDGKQLPGD